MAKYSTQIVEYVTEDQLTKTDMMLDFIPSVGMDLVIGWGCWRVHRVQVTIHGPAKLEDPVIYKVLCIVKASEGPYEL